MNRKPTTIKHLLAIACLTFLTTACGGGSDEDNKQEAKKYFNRVATFPVCKQIDNNCNTDKETVAEIVSASDDGMYLFYTDGEQKQIGKVDIKNVNKPKKAGTIAIGGEPTSVFVKGKYAFVGVNTSKSKIEPSGMLKVLDVSGKTMKEVASIDLKGQPDSVAVSPDGKYAAIAIENERDEDFSPTGKKENKGDLPQLPAGKLVVVDLSDADPKKWAAKDVAMTGLKGMLEAADPEPEYVDINDDNIALVTMQENNHIALVDLAKAVKGEKSVIKHFSAGSVNLTKVDVKRQKPGLIEQTKELNDVPREPDGATWIGNDYFVIANEGDWKGGSRNFSVFDKEGNVVYDAGNTLEHLVTRIGHYPEKRSGKKGNEPENAEYGVFGKDKLLVVASERSSVLAVYDVGNPKKPVYKQVLPAGVGPEGVLAIPSRNLLIAASEKDDRGDKMRSSLNIYSYQEVDAPAYPTLVSADNENGTPIPWGALSGLAVDGSTLYSVEDSYYGKNRIFTIDTTQKPAKITQAMRLKDANDKLSKHSDKAVKKLVNKDKTVNIDPEGIAISATGGFWVVSEGSGTVGDKKKPYNYPNLLLKTDANANITDVVTLPKELNDVQLRFGFEGVAEEGDKVYVAFQRAWNKEANPRIGIYDTVAKTWSFVYYPLDKAESQRKKKSWVGLSEIAPLGNSKFAVLERDNQGGPDAAIKRIYEIDLSNVKAGDTITKKLKRDLMKKGDLTKTGGLPAEKVEGLAVDAKGNYWIVNDNDGVDDNSGETQLINLGKL